MSLLPAGVSSQRREEGVYMKSIYISVTRPHLPEALALGLPHAAPRYVPYR